LLFFFLSKRTYSAYSFLCSFLFYLSFSELGSPCAAQAGPELLGSSLPSSWNPQVSPDPTDTVTTRQTAVTLVDIKQAEPSGIGAVLPREVRTLAGGHTAGAGRARLSF
jgi:hypothetical protein